MDPLAPSLDLVASALSDWAKPLISWDRVKDGLKNTADRLSTWEKIDGDLSVIANQLSLLVTMKKISPLVGKKFKIGTRPVLANLKDVKADVNGEPVVETHQTYSDLCAAAIEYLDKNTKIPINVDWSTMEMEEIDLREPPFMTIFNPGFELTWDDWSDYVRDNPDGFVPAWAFHFFLFFTFSLTNVEENLDGVYHVWKRWSETHPWGVEPPWWLFVNGWAWNYPKFRRALRRSPWPNLAVALDMVYHETDNRFLDYEYNEGYSNMDPTVSLGVEDLRDAIREANRANKILEQANSVGKLALKQKAIYSTFLELAEKCLEPSRDFPACNVKADQVKGYMAKLKEEGLKQLALLKAGATIEDVEGEGSDSDEEFEEETEDVYDN